MNFGTNFSRAHGPVRFLIINERKRTIDAIAQSTNHMACADGVGELNVGRGFEPNFRKGHGFVRFLFINERKRANAITQSTKKRKMVRKQ